MWNNLRLSRRTWLKTLAASEFCALVPAVASGRNQARAARVEAVSAYLKTLARPGGGYARDDQTEPHLTPTFAVVGCARLLNLDLPDRPALVEFI
ncbi:MAG: prenyltransferase, partial [Isosphaeraceae bacterium]